MGDGGNISKVVKTVEETTDRKLRTLKQRVMHEALHIIMVGGSVASSWLGVPRTTLDVDVVADLNADLAMALCRVLSISYYVDLGAVTEAIHSQSSFNLIHEDTMQKRRLRAQAAPIRSAKLCAQA